MIRKTLLAATALVGSVAAAHAFDTTATAGYDLRAAPMDDAAVVASVPAGGTTTLEGCLQAQDWCQMSYNGMSGWAKANVFQVMDNGQPVEISSVGTQVNTVTYTEGNDTTQGAAALSGVAAGAAAGAAVGGPAGGVVGALIGGVLTGEAAEPTTETITYVTQNPVNPVLVEGELKTGSVLPEGAMLTPVPDTEYSYLYIDKTPVIVNPQTRQIVYIVQ